MGYIGTRPANAPLTSADIADGVVTTPKLATDAVETVKVKDLNVTNAKIAATTIDVTAKITGVVPTANLGSGSASASTYLAGNQTYQTITEYDDSVLQSNVAMLGFKVAVNGSLTRYNLVDQSIDEFYDTSGVDASASTDEVRTASGANYYYSGTSTGSSSGGTLGSYGSYISRTFLADGNLVVTGSGTVDFLLVGGGGMGGFDSEGDAGGGGAGGFRVITGHSLAAGTHAIVVGDGGAAGSLNTQNNGDSSTALTYTSIGGGAGSADSGNPGVDGASGGGGGGESGTLAKGDEIGSPTQGNDGGIGGQFTTGVTRAGGGGGGAGAVGQAASSGQGGNGGIGTDNNYRTGVNITYAGGGAGGSKTTGGTGGSGGGGNGASSGTTGVTAGGVNTGGGGGGGGASSAGGSGIVVIRIADDQFTTAYNDMTLQSTDVTAEATPTYGEFVTLIEDGAGTATLNTDIKGYVSRDSGVTFTQGTLVDEGTWGTNKKILGFHDLTITGSAGTSMCYKIETLNQSVSKQTRVYATSIGWR